MDQTANGLDSRIVLWGRLLVGGVMALISALFARIDPPYVADSWVWLNVGASLFALWPFVLISGLGQLRVRNLLIWGLGSGLLIGLISAWFASQANMSEARHLEVFVSPWMSLILPVLFISHALVSGADADQKPIAAYQTYFDIAWKFGVQLGLALLFTILFWVVVMLGAGLLDLIGLGFLQQAIRQKEVYYTLTGVAFAAGVHLSDVQPKLLHSARAILLNVLRWLLPLAAGLILVFLVGLAVQGLAPLWKTGAATNLLLSACVLLVLLMNAAWGAGESETSGRLGLFSLSLRLSAGMVLILSALAAYSLWLRIDQYGLTPQRFLAATGVVISLAYGLAYAGSIRTGWRLALAPVNIALAFIKVALLLLVLSPVADPNRLSVLHQLERLRAGKLTAETFDYTLLRYGTGQYGAETLEAMASAWPQPEVRAKAKAELARESRDPLDLNPPKATRAEAIGRIPVVMPKGGTLPATFAQTDFGPMEIWPMAAPDCLKSAQPEACHAALINLDGDPAAEILILEGNRVTRFDATDKSWSITSLSDLCEADAKAFIAGTLRTRPQTVPQLVIGNRPITPQAQAAPVCAEAQ